MNVWADIDQAHENDAAPATYTTLGAWVQGWLAVTYRRQLGGGSRVWCAKWREHAEAVERLDVMWRTWEQTRDNPAKRAAWWRDIADPTMRVLLDADGPFSACRNGSHRDLAPLPTNSSTSDP